MPSISTSVTLAPCAACSGRCRPSGPSWTRPPATAVPQARQVAQAAAEGSVVANFFLSARSFVPVRKRYLDSPFGQCCCWVL
jgi:hypothetical protein